MGGSIGKGCRHVNPQCGSGRMFDTASTPDHAGSVPGMAFKAKWGREQRQAIEDAALVHGWSIPKVHTAAQAGSLPGIGARLEPFDIGISTVGDYITQARRRQRAEADIGLDPTAVLQEQAMTLVNDYKSLLAKTRGTKSKRTAAEIVELAKAGRELSALLRALDPQPRRNGAKTAREPVETGNEDEAPDFLDTLATNGSP